MRGPAVSRHVPAWHSSPGSERAETRVSIHSLRPARWFTNDPSAGYPPAGLPWNGSRVLYLMHPSDPIVWWGPSLILQKPDWTSEPPGKDVLGSVVWIPFVTFWQITADLPFATAVPGGHGHKYTSEYVDAWYTVMQPPGITDKELASLRTIISTDT